MADPGKPPRFANFWQHSIFLSESRMSSSQSGLGRRQRGSRSPKRSTITNTTKSGPYDHNFQQNLIDHGAYPDKYLYPDGQRPPQPGNLQETRQVLKQRHRSLSPSVFPEEKFEVFQYADAHTSEDSQIIADVIPTIQGDVQDRKCVGRQIPFTCLDDLTDGTIVSGNPDLYYGASPGQLKRKIRKDLEGHPSVTWHLARIQLATQLTPQARHSSLTLYRCYMTLICRPSNCPKISIIHASLRSPQKQSSQSVGNQQRPEAASRFCRMASSRVPSFASLWKNNKESHSSLGLSIT